MTGKELKEFRLKHGLTQSELAEIVGVKPNTVSKWESGIRNIGQSAIRLLHSYVPELDKPKERDTQSGSVESVISKKVLAELGPKMNGMDNKLDEIIQIVSELIINMDRLHEKSDKTYYEVTKNK